jgi:hypothetical protein
MDWIDLAQDRDHWRALVNTVMNLGVSLNGGKFLSTCTTGGFSRRSQLHEVRIFLNHRQYFPPKQWGLIPSESFVLPSSVK